MIYLDYAATTPLDPQVAAVMQEALLAGYANPASQHQAGQRARRVLENAREEITALLGGRTTGMDADRLVFTSGGTEANNLALLGLAGLTPSRVLVSAIEHPSVMGAAQELLRRGYQVEFVPVDANGLIRLDRLREQLATSPTPRVVSVMLANNEIGVIQPIAEIAKLCRERGVLCHTDAVQAVGKVPVSFSELGASAMTIAAHKFHGPVGIGALLLAGEVKLDPQLHGGFQQAAIRPGTEAVVLAVGFAAALRQAVKLQPEHHKSLCELTHVFLETLRSLSTDFMLHAAEVPRAPHVLNLTFRDVNRQELFLALDAQGICCSTGSACASGSSEPSPVLQAMGVSEADLASSLRFSFGPGQTIAEVKEAAERISKCVNHLRHKNSAAKSRLTSRGNA